MLQHINHHIMLYHIIFLHISYHIIWNITSVKWSEVIWPFTHFSAKRNASGVVWIWVTWILIFGQKRTIAHKSWFSFDVLRQSILLLVVVSIRTYIQMNILRIGRGIVLVVVNIAIDQCWFAICVQRFQFLKPSWNEQKSPISRD